MVHVNSILGAASPASQKNAACDPMVRLLTPSRVTPPRVGPKATSKDKLVDDEVNTLRDEYSHVAS